MGYYINPRDMSKEQWLKIHGRPINAEDIPTETMDKEMPVCLVSNGAFTAAAICYCEEEWEEFRSPRDFRPKEWYMVPRDKLREFYPNA